MSTILLNKVATQELGGDDFEDLLDHRLGTGKAKYRLEGDFGELVLPIDLFDGC